MNSQFEKLTGLEAHLLSKIKGQDHAISSVCSVLERGQLGLQPAGKPLGSFLFLGPTGVGKTEMTLEFSRYLFGEDSVFRFDMSEFLHLDNVKLFTGDETGSACRLGKVLSEHRRGILLFDEIEKAHRLIWDLFLQMLDAARITLANHHHSAPFAGGAESHRSGGMVCRAFNGPLDAMSVREMTDVSVVLINKSPAGPQETVGIFTCSNRGQRMALIPKLTR